LVSGSGDEPNANTPVAVVALVRNSETREKVWEEGHMWREDRDSDDVFERRNSGLLRSHGRAGGRPSLKYVGVVNLSYVRHVPVDFILVRVSS
jgi:hypothetical protein